MDKKIFSKKFKELVNQQDISYVELSKKVDIRQDKLSKFANPNNSVKPSIDDLIALSQYFNISIDELIGNDISTISVENNKNNMYEFISLIFRLNEILPLNLNFEETEIIYLYDQAPCNDLFRNFSLSIKLDNVELIKQAENISKFLEDWIQVQHISKSMPEIQKMWEDKKLKEIQESYPMNLSQKIPKNKDGSIRVNILKDLPFN